MTDKKIYKNDSIVSVTPREFTRMRAGVYCGSTEYSTQLMRELFSNALDEHNIGHGNLIKIVVDTKENLYSIEDQGQGFPINIKTKYGTTVLEDAFSRLNTSGKYDENGVYGGSALGLNGIGAKLPCFLSSFLIVDSTNNKGQSEYITFKDGIFQSRTVYNKGKNSGTYIAYQPDPQFFTHVEANRAELDELFTETSALCPNLTISFSWNGEEKIYQSKKGILDLFDKKVKNKEILSNRFICKKIDGDNLCEVCLTYTSDYSDNIIGYVNYGKTDSGVHYTALKSSLTRVFNTFAQENGLLKKNDNNLSGNELSEGLTIMFNLKANGVQYDSQSKTRVVGIDRTLINSVILNDFYLWLNNNKKDGKMIIERALKARKANDAARKAKEAVRAPKEKGLRAKMSISDKFVDCVSKDPKERNLLILEGLSAGSSAIEARNVKTDCIYMLRGKILSTLKTDETKILANQELSDIIKIVGAGYGKTFDINKMDFDKIVITTDADSDGANIELLLTTFFYTYMRPLVEQGHLYRAVTPLYIVRNKKEELYFYTDNEYNKWRESHPTPEQVVRAKGLGEINSADLHKICFEQERYKRITVSDIENTTKLLQTLMGKDVNPRKQYIYDNASHLGFNFQ